jgi:hypothetical protein
VQFLPLLLALSFGPHGHASHRARLDVDVLAPVSAATPEVETLGAILGAGVVLPGELHLGLDGQPAMPFLNPFFYSQEIRITQMDPMSLAGQLMVTARLEW